MHRLSFTLRQIVRVRTCVDVCGGLGVCAQLADIRNRNNATSNKSGRTPRMKPTRIYKVVSLPSANAGTRPIATTIKSVSATTIPPAQTHRQSFANPAALPPPQDGPAPLSHRPLLQRLPTDVAPARKRKLGRPPNINGVVVPRKGKDFTSFDDAKGFAHTLKFTTQKEWQAWCKTSARPANIPSNPAYAYKDHGWQGYGHWLGTGKVAYGQEHFWGFKQAHEYALNLKLRGVSEWEKWSKGPKRPTQIPTNPHRTYKNRGWQGHGHWLGTSTKGRPHAKKDLKRARKASTTAFDGPGDERKAGTTAFDGPGDGPGNGPGDERKAGTMAFDGPGDERPAGGVVTHVIPGVMRPESDISGEKDLDAETALTGTSVRQGDDRDVAPKSPRLQ